MEGLKYSRTTGYKVLESPKNIFLLFQTMVWSEGGMCNRPHLPFPFLSLISSLLVIPTLLSFLFCLDYIVRLYQQSEKGMCNGPHFLACMTPWGHYTYIGFVWHHPLVMPIYMFYLYITYLRHYLYYPISLLPIHWSD